MALRMLWVASTLALIVGCSTGPAVRTETGQIVPLASQDLADQPPDRLAQRIAVDAVALKAVTAGVRTLEERGWFLKAGLEARPGKFTQAENDQIRRLLLSYINYRTALFRMVAFHSSYETVPDEAQRLRSFMIYYTAGITLFARGLALAQMMEDSPNATRKLNEPEPIWGVPADVFDTVYDNVTHEGNVELLGRTRGVYARMKPQIEAAGVFEGSAFGWMPGYLAAEEAGIEKRLPRYDNADWVRFARETKALGSSIWYAIQAFFANLAGDTRVWPAQARITAKGVADLADELKPGDIILARKNFYISNGFLPGFWPHAILYVGTPEELEARGLTDRPWVSKHLDAYRSDAQDGNPHRVIEAISQGVVFSSLEQVMHSDFVAVLRPRMSEARKDLAIERAFSHLGKPYDFDFDFFSTDAVVCTELVYRAYDEAMNGERLDLEMQRILGRDTYPAIEFVRKFAEEWDADEERAEAGLEPQRQLDFVAYLAGDERQDMDDFMDTADRPSTPERQGFTLGVAGGYHFGGAGWLPLDETLHGGTFTVRAGHSLSWSLLLQYALSGAPHAIEGRNHWRLSHLANLQWHPTRLLIVSLGLGVEHGFGDDPRSLGPAGAFELGYEFLQGYSWALDLRAYYRASTAWDFGAPRAAAGIGAGIQFY